MDCPGLDFLEAAGTQSGAYSCEFDGCRLAHGLGQWLVSSAAAAPIFWDQSTGLNPPGNHLTLTFRDICSAEQVLDGG